MAIPWFQMSQCTAPFRSWNQLKRAIEIEFGPSMFESPREILFKLQQSGSVTEYCSEFVALENHTNVEPPDALRDCFISGLKPDVRREVKAQCPPSLMRAISLARLYEDKFATNTKPSHGPSISRPPLQPQTSNTSNRTPPRQPLPPLLPTPPLRTLPNPNRNQVKRLTSAEIQNRRDKGLCYWCDENFFPGHKCPHKHLMLLQLEEDEEQAIEEPMTAIATVPELLPQLDQQVVDHHLSYNAMNGNSGPATIRIKAFINGVEIQALIDGGSSHSFIQPRIAQFLNLPVQPAPGFRVMVGNFDMMTVEGCIPTLEVTMQCIKVDIPKVYVLHVAGGDLVIGTTWLKTLKAHIVDYDSSFIRFLHDGKFVTVFGDKSHMPAPAQFHHIKRMVHTNAIAEAFTIQVHKTTATGGDSVQLPQDCFPIPTVDELLDKLFGATVFSKLDLKSGYHQILVHLADRYKTAFRTHQGHYEWLVMPFGLTNAPATFQGLMNDVFRPYLRKFVLVFFDDILVYSPSWNSHLQHLETVLQVLQRETLFAKLSKCLFGVTEIDYLGHTILGNGVHMEKDKVQAILDWQQPQNLKQLRGFLGLTGYYRRFIKGYASMAAPLTDLLKKDSFQWSDKAERALQELKAAVTSKPVLALPNFLLPFVIECDASGVGIGAVLSQGKYPIAYFSKKLVPTMQHQQSLKALLTQNLHTPEQQKWLHKLLGYDFEIQYTSGKENVVTDALSRSFFAAWSSLKLEWLQLLQNDIEQDEHWNSIKQRCLNNNMQDSNYICRNGILL
ncbi:uncharacterized protein [Arachis hypogaea]|uniref:uncharacterized protein n=1 Tax=Arachis hypogaea TaxID=3818 RepID=UPI003B21B7EC